MPKGRGYSLRNPPFSALKLNKTKQDNTKNHGSSKMDGNSMRMGDMKRIDLKKDYKK